MTLPRGIGEQLAITGTGVAVQDVVDNARKAPEALLLVNLDAKTGQDRILRGRLVSRWHSQGLLTCPEG